MGGGRREVVGTETRHQREHACSGTGRNHQTIIREWSGVDGGEKDSKQMSIEEMLNCSAIGNKYRMESRNGQANMHMCQGSGGKSSGFMVHKDVWDIMEGRKCKVDTGFQMMGWRGDEMVQCHDRLVS